MYLNIEAILKVLDQCLRRLHMFPSASSQVSVHEFCTACAPTSLGTFLNPPPLFLQLRYHCYSSFDSGLCPRLVVTEADFELCIEEQQIYL